MSARRVLVTGGAGFIGSHIVSELLDSGHEPYVLDNFSSGRRENVSGDVPLFEVDVCDRERLARVLREIRPDWVMHQAAQISVSHSVADPSLDASVNVMGWLNVLEECRRIDVQRIVFASSGGVLYGDVWQPADEEHSVQPISPYGISKWSGELYLRFFARQYNVQGVALRYANVYGPRQDPHGEAGVVAIFIQRMLQGRAPVIFGDGGNVRDYVYVRDVARANVMALTAPLAGSTASFNIGTGIGTTVIDLEEQLRTLIKPHLQRRDLSAEVQPSFGPPRPGDLRSSMVSAKRALTVLGWQPEVRLADGLAATVDWFAQQPGAP